MKYISITLLFVLTFLFSCQEGAEYKDAIYITQTETSDKIDIVVDGSKTIGVTATSSCKVLEDVNVLFEVSPEKLEAYNKKVGKNYVMPPADSYVLNNPNATIKKSATVSNPVELSVLSLEHFEKGLSYCIPISIKQVSGNSSILKSSKTIFVVIKTITTTRAGIFNGNDLCVEKFSTDPVVRNIGQMTLECSFKVNHFSWINSVLGIEENFLMRCVDWDNDGNYNLEMGPMTIGGKKYFHAAKSNLIPGKWYHAAIVCTGSQTSLYINGLLDSQFSGRSGAIDLSLANKFFFGTSCNSRPLKGAISEARIWTKALTSSEIQENMCYVNPTSEGLLACWKFDAIQSDGSVLDLTGHGYNAINPRNGNLSFEDNVKCPF